MKNDNAYKLMSTICKAYRKENNENLKLLYHAFFDNCVQYLERYIDTKDGIFTVIKIERSDFGIKIFYKDSYGDVYYDIV